MPSKKIKIRCNYAFVHGQIRSAEAIEALARGSRGVGSYFATIHSDRVGTGLTDEEIKLIMPVVLAMSDKDLDFRKKVEGHFLDINTLVDYVQGTELEIGLELDNSKPVTYTETVKVPQGEGLPDKEIISRNTPISFEQWVAYRHALSHPRCAASPEAAKGNKTYEFFVEDPEQVDKLSKKLLDIADQSMAAFAMVKTDQAKVRYLLALLQEQNMVKKKPNEIAIIVGSMSPEERLVRLREAATEHPEEFMKLANDDLLKPRFQLIEFLRMGLLIEAGNSTIIVPGSGQPLGDTRQKAVVNLFQNPENSQLLQTLKAQMADKINS